jgi:pilus assembly protein CpaB
MTRRILAITIAIALAGLGAAGGLFLIMTADQRARANIEDAVTVAIATKRIPIGTTGARVRQGAMMRLERMPKSSVPADALSDISPELDRMVITSNIAVGQVLLAAHFGEQSNVTSGLPLPEGKMAVTVQTGAPEQVAGYVQPGAQVVVFVTYELLDNSGKKTNIERTRVLLPRVEVLAVGTYQAEQTRNNGNPVTGTATLRNTVMVTLAVNQQEAERLISGLSTGTLYLGLLTESVEVRTGSGVENTDASGGTSPLFK